MEIKMEQPNKPLPVVNPWAKPFWDAANEERLTFQKCEDCGANIFYPRIACPDCFSDNLGWVDASGKGTVYSYTVVENNAPTAFAADCPYVVAIVKLEEGVQMLTNIVNCDPYLIQCDMPVKVVFEVLNDDFKLPKFQPV
jgi:uncharacterized OB-fold protein